MSTTTTSHIEQLQLLVAEISALDSSESESQFQVAFDNSCSALLSQFKEVLFSDVPDITLRRFYSFQLEFLLRLTDQVQQIRGNAPRLAYRKLEEVITALTSLYGRFIDSEIYIRPSQIISRTNILNERLDGLLNMPASAQLHPYYQNWLRNFTQENQITPLSRISLEAFKYLEAFVANLSDAFALSDFADVQLETCLLQNNLNDLAYYAAWSKVQSEKINSASMMTRSDEISDLQFKIAVCPEKVNTIYHQDWPSLKQLQLGWLQEILQRVCKEAAASGLPMDQPNKLPLNLSVSQLACLIHLMKADNLIGEECLKDIFKFFAAHFSTKRQHQISWSSLSKEFYSISQVTAAVTRSMLQDMINRINKEFFPA